MDRFQNDFSSIILNEIALEGLDGITIEALCKRLSNHPNWPLKPVDDSIKKIVWSFVVCLKNVDFYRLKSPRDPLVIFNRFEYIHNEFGSLYEPSTLPHDIYPNHPIEDGQNMGSCQEYFTRFNLGSFPRKISVEEAEKRWTRRLVIVASQEVRTKVLIPDDKQCTLNLSLRYYLILERIGRSRYLGEASFGVHSLRIICPDSKTLSYIRNRLTDDGLIQNQALAFSRSSNTLVANRIVISSLTKFFVKRESLIDQMVSRIVDFLKLQPNFTATYEQVKTQCDVSFAKTFKQPLLKKFCDTNLMLNYRALHPDAPESEYSCKRNESNKEKVLRCIRLKLDGDKEKSEVESNKKVEGREFKLDSTFERQILRWIERHGSLGVTLSDISVAFKFTTGGTIEKLLKKFIGLKYVNKRYCDRGRSKVFSYIANSYTSPNKTDKHEGENMIAISEPEIKVNNNELVSENGTIQSTTVIDKLIKIENSEESDEEPLITKSIKHGYCKFNESFDYTTANENDNYDEEKMLKIVEPEIKILKLENEDIPNATMIDNSIEVMENCDESDSEPSITRSMKYGYCKSVFESSRQSISFTDRFFYRQQIIFHLLSTENIISLINLKKSIIELEKQNKNFIGTLDIKTLVKIVGHLEILGKLKSVQYQVVYDGKTVNYSFVGTLDVDFDNEEVIAYMNSFMNHFNNKMKTSRANRKWNLVVQSSPEPKVNIAELKLPKFMKMRSLHEYLFYIVYEHPGESLTNACNETKATVERYRTDILNGDTAELPKVYHPTISWKMFVPPLQKYPKYPPGWFFVSDIIHHMPLELMLKIVNFNKSKVNLEKLSTYASHPVFKYLPLMSLSAEVRNALSQGLKKHIQNTLNALRYLCMIGLLQFGEKQCKDTELIYAYLNKRASLLNTVKSSPNYYRVSDMDYEKRTYDFTCGDHELETFWLDTWYFCTNTPLGYRVMKLVNIPKRRDIMEKSKIAIEDACTSRAPLEAIANDDGTIPGDNKGAAGFDSHLFSHLARNWSIKKRLSTTVFPKRRTTIGHSILQKIKKHNHNRKQSEKKKTERAMHQLYSLRYKWTPDEDQVLLFWKLGAMFAKQVESHAFISYGLKDVIRSILGKFYRLKSVDNYLRRIRILMRYASIEARVNDLLEELKADKEIEDLFKFDLEKQHELHKAKKFKAMRDLIISNIKQLIDILLERGITIDTKCTVNGKKKTRLKNCNHQEASTSNKHHGVGHLSKIQFNFSKIIDKPDSTEEAEQMFTKDTIYTSIVLSLIHSSLTNQSANPKISLTYLQAFKQYPEDILKQAFCILKDSNLITCSQYHKVSLQVLLTTSHIIQSKTYDYGPKFSTMLVGSTDTERYKNAFNAYSGIGEDLSEQKMLLLNPSFGLCSVLTSLCLMDVIHLSIEFDKKFLGYMSDENLEDGTICLKNTLKRMRSRHFDLLSNCSNDSAEFDKIITSVTKQLKNYQVTCKLKKQSIQNLEDEIDKISENIFSRPTFEPQLQYIGKLNNLCTKILVFCKNKEQYGATQQDIKVNFAGFSLSALAKSLNNLRKKHLILVAGVKTPTYVHYDFINLWLVKIPCVNWSNVEAEMNKDDTLTENTVLEESEPIQPPTKKIRREPEIEDVDEKLDFLKVRPWTRMDLTINKKSLEYFLNSVISKIIVKPGIYLKHLIKDYYPILQPMQTRELVEILVDMKCVKMIHLENVQKPSLFSDPLPQNHDLKFSVAIGLEDNSSVMIEPTQDCEIRFGYFSNNFKELSKVN